MTGIHLYTKKILSQQLKSLVIDALHVNDVVDDNQYLWRKTLHSFLTALNVIGLQ